MDPSSSPFSLRAGRAERSITPDERLFGEAEALAEAQRCLYCYDAPCAKGCPAGVDVPEFIRNVQTGAWKAAARLVLSANALGESCGCICPTEVLCVGECVLGRLEGQPPVAIGRLQRYVVNRARTSGVEVFARAPATGRKVALVGAGPASLACAYELARRGHEPVLFEASRTPGGLNTHAMAPHKMHAEVPLAELEWLLRMGGKLHAGVAVGEDISFGQLESEFDAVFLGVGLGADRRLGIPREGARSVLGAIQLLRGLKTGDVQTPLPWDRVVCVGGGNSAVDVVRTLRDLDVPEVVLVYRRAEAQMPGYPHEWAAARAMGVETHFLTQPLEVLTDGERVTGLRCIRMELGAPDTSGRPRPVPVPGSTFDIHAEAVVMALGQAGARDVLPGLPRDITFEGAHIAVNASTGATSRPGWYAGGDCANGGKEVVNAAAEGQRAARAIDAYLAGKGD